MALLRLRLLLLMINKSCMPWSWSRMSIKINFSIKLLLKIYFVLSCRGLWLRVHSLFIFLSFIYIQGLSFLFIRRHSRSKDSGTPFSWGKEKGKETHLLSWNSQSISCWHLSKRVESQQWVLKTTPFYGEPVLLQVIVLILVKEALSWLFLGEFGDVFIENTDLEGGFIPPSIKILDNVVKNLVETKRKTILSALTDTNVDELVNLVMPDLMYGMSLINYTNSCSPSYEF